MASCSNRDCGAEWEDTPGRGRGRLPSRHVIVPGSNPISSSRRPACTVAICVLNKAKPAERRGRVLFVDAAHPPGHPCLSSGPSPLCWNYIDKDAHRAGSSKRSSPPLRTLRDASLTWQDLDEMRRPTTWHTQWKDQPGIVDDYRRPVDVLRASRTPWRSCERCKFAQQAARMRRCFKMDDTAFIRSRVYVR